MINSFSSTWLLAAIAIGQAAPPQATTAAPEFPEIAARVNGTDITRTALLNRATALKGQLPANQVGADFYKRVLDDMVGGELLYQTVEKRGLAPTAQEIDAESKLHEKRSAGLMPYGEVEGRIDEFLKRRGLQQKIENEIQTLTAQGNVEVFI